MGEQRMVRVIVGVGCAALALGAIYLLARSGGTKPPVDKPGESPVGSLATNPPAAPGVNIQEPGVDAATAMVDAAGAGSVDALDALLRNNGDARARAADGRTPILAACQTGTARAVELLIAHGASADEGDSEGITPMIATVRGEGPERVEKLLILLSAGAAADRADSLGRTPLHHACARGEGEGIVALLLDAGVDPDARDDRGRTALMLAADRADADQVMLLLASGADASITLADGTNAAAMARGANDARLAAALEEAAAR